ncbi:MAG: phosphoenolpyruvate--protein phosphotransferase, partial [Endomicrobiia bacterium]
MDKKPQTEVVKGVIASEGIAIGNAFLIEEEEFCVIPRRISKQKVKSEVERFKNAIEEVRKELLSAEHKILKILGKKHSPLVESYLLMLDDPILSRDVTKRISEEYVNAEYALWATLDKVIQSFDRIDDEYFRDRKNDIYEIGKRILSFLAEEKKKSISDAEEGSIVVVHSLSPDDVFRLKEKKIVGFVTDVGGRTSHISILAQGLELPAVVGLKDITTRVNHGDLLIIDGTQGIVIINPDDQTLQNYKREYEIQVREREELKKLRDLPAETVDGHRVILACNVDLPEEMDSVLSSGAEGIGLFRTEFLYLGRDKLPIEEEHYEIYKTIAKKILPYSLIIRTVDLGGDKLPQLGLEKLTKEDNPFLGLRAIRLCLRYPELFRTQLRAILRASKEGKIKIMFPMISGVEEFIQARKFLEQVKSELKSQGEEFDENIEVGAMIEVPSAALTADVIAKSADFLSIGTNDLIQYTLAVDRKNEAVADMYEPLHLSILRLLKHIIDAGHNAGKWVGMCGEMASDPTFTTILIGMGLNEFSVPPVAVPKIKKIIRKCSLIEARELAREILGTTDRNTIVSTLKKTLVV